MTVTPFANRIGLQGRFLGAVAFVFFLQVALLFWSGDRSNRLPEKPLAAPAFRLGDSRPVELAAMEDPTLFVLPHQQGFSGGAWMKIPPLTFRPQYWSEDEPLRWLITPQEKLGTAFAEFMESNPATPFPTIVTIEPTLTFPQLPPAAEISQPSALRISGEVAARRLIFCSPLRAWSSTELQTNSVGFLTNSVVQLVIDSQGDAFSAVLLGAGSGYDKANEEALRIAQTMRFESLEPVGPDRLTVPEPKLMLGTLTFEWQTLPTATASTNLP
jgi:hypothetical protein